MPAGPRVPREDLQVRAGAARFDYLIELVRLAAVLTLSGQKNIFLSASGLESAGVFASCAEKNELRDVAEIESNTRPGWATVNYDPSVKTFLAPTQTFEVLIQPSSDKKSELFGWQTALVRGNSNQN